MKRAGAFTALGLLTFALVVLAAFQGWPGTATRTSAPRSASMGSATTTPPAPTGTAVPPSTLPTSAPHRIGYERPPSPWTAPARYLVLIVLDGARPDYFSVPNIPHVRELTRNGTQYTQAWAGILESETPTGHAALGTGSAPRENGIPSFDWATSDNIPVSLFDPKVINDGDLERIIADSHAPTIAGLVHQHDPTAKVVALSGHKYYAADAIGGPKANVIMYYTGTPNGMFVPTFVPGHEPPRSVLSSPGLTVKNSHIPLGVEDHLAMKLAIRTFEAMRQRVTLINLPEFDWPLGHVDGGDRDPAAVRTLMQGFDRGLAELEAAYRTAGILDHTLFVITADHGFAPIYHTASHDAIDKAIQEAGTSVISGTYHTGAFIWLKDESKANRAAANIAHLQNPYIQSVYFREAIPGGFDYVRATSPTLFRAPGMEAANQYLLRTFNGPSAPDLAVFFTEDSASLPGGEASWKGDHGGASWESQHIPLIFSGPGVRRGYLSQQPARLIDVAPTALTLMGVPDTGMQGIPLADAMQSPSSSAVATLRAQGNALLPIVTALQQESRREIAGGR